MIDIESIRNYLQHSNTSYKSFLLLYLIKEINTIQKEITFKELAIGMLVEAWSYQISYLKRFTLNDRIYDLFRYIVTKYSEYNYITQSQELIDFLKSTKDPIIEKGLKQLVIYAPYRLLVDEDLSIRLKNVVDRKKNKIIEKYSQENNCIYTILGKKIILNDNAIIDIKQCQKAFLHLVRENIEVNYL